MANQLEPKPTLNGGESNAICAWCDLPPVSAVTVKAIGFDGKEFNVSEDLCERHRDLRIGAQLAGKPFNPYR